MPVRPQPTDPAARAVERPAVPGMHPPPEIGPPAGAAAKQPDTRHSKTVRSEPRKRLDVLVLGDSMIGGYFGLMLVRQLNGINGVRARRIFAKSTGLAQYFNYNWHGKSLNYVRRFKPDILIVMFGTNDTAAVRGYNGRLVRYNRDPETWKKIYSLRVHRYLKALEPLVDRIYLVGQPAIDHYIFTKKFPVLNSVYRAECARFDRVTFLPAWQWTSVNNKYTPYLVDRAGHRGRVKPGNDPVHHSPFGGRQLAELVIEKIGRDFKQLGGRSVGEKQWH